MIRHLQRKAWCQCKDAGWTIDDACAGQKRYEKDSKTNQATISITGNNVVHNQQVNITFHVTVAGAGSEQEREYLRQHAEQILKAVEGGSDKANVDMIERAARIAWCSDEHPVLNNVVAVASNGTNQYLVLRDEGGQLGITALAGKTSKEEILQLAENLVKTLTTDAARGHDPTIHTLGHYGETCDTREEAQALHEAAGCEGEVMLVDRWGSAPRHKGKFGSYWVNMRDHNPVPNDPTVTETLAATT